MTTADPRQKQSYECETVAAARTIVSGRRTGRRQAATVTQTNFWRIFWIPVGEVSIQAGMADRHVSVRPHRCGLPAPARPGPPGAAVLAGAAAGGGGATAGRWGPRQPRPPLRRNPGPGASAPDPHPDFTFFRRRLPTCDPPAINLSRVITPCALLPILWPLAVSHFHAPFIPARWRDWWRGWRGSWGIRTPGSPPLRAGASPTFAVRPPRVGGTPARRTRFREPPCLGSHGCPPRAPNTRAGALGGRPLPGAGGALLFGPAFLFKRTIFD